MVVEDGERAGDEDGEEDGDGSDPAHARLLDFYKTVSKLVVNYNVQLAGDLPGSCRSGLRSINGPSPVLGAATSVLLAIAYLTLEVAYLGRTLVLSNRGSIVCYV